MTAKRRYVQYLLGLLEDAELNLRQIELRGKQK